MVGRKCHVQSQNHQRLSSIEWFRSCSFSWRESKHLRMWFDWCVHQLGWPCLNHYAHLLGHHHAAAFCFVRQNFLSFENYSHNQCHDFDLIDFWNFNNYYLHLISKWISQIFKNFCSPLIWNLSSNPSFLNF